MQCGKHVGQILSRIHSAFPHLVDTGPVTKEFVIQLFEFRLIVGLAWIIGWFRSSNLSPVLYKFVNGAQDGKRHVLAVGIESQHFVVHATFGRDETVVYAEFVDQSVSIYVVKAEPGW